MESLNTWIEGFHAPVPDELIGKARKAIARILVEPSELLELWADSDDLDSWKRSLEEIIQRL